MEKCEILTSIILWQNGQIPPADEDHVIWYEAPEKWLNTPCGKM